MHQIRLHGLWQVASVDGAVSTNADPSTVATSKIQIPAQWADWLRESNCKSAILERAFGLPTGLEPQQDIWLVIEAVHLSIAMWLNDRSIGTLMPNDSRVRVSVRRFLQVRNRLRLTIDLQQTAEDRKSTAGDQQLNKVHLEID